MKDPIGNANGPMPGRRLLNRDTVEEIYGISKRFLEISAFRGDGPPYVKVGRSVRYRPEDLDAWIARQRIDPTAGGPAVI